MASANSPITIPSNQSPLLLLNNMSNLMSTKLDSSNYMIWKLQITAVLDAYSMLDHPRWIYKALLTLLYSTCSSSVLAMVVGKSSSQEVWNTLEERFTSTARSNVLNLKLELQSIKKAGNETVSSYLQRIKTVRDKLSAVGVHSDHEELTHVILKGLPKEFAPFASAIRTRDTILSLEKLTVLLQTEEQSMNEATESLSNSALAMFVSHNKPNFNGNQGFNRGRGRNSYSRGRGGGGRNSSFHQGFSSPNASPQMNFAYQGKNPTTKLAAMASASNLHYTQNTESWLTDTGATDHITANANNLSPQAPYQGQEQVSVGNGQNLPIQNIDNNCSCYFDAKKFSIQDLPTGRILYKGLSNNGVYPIQSPMFIPAANKTACAAHSISSDKWHLWHSRLGHPSDKVLANVFPCFSPNSSSKDVKVHCHHCLAGKMHQLPFPTSNKTITSPFELVHADLWGPAPVVASNSFRFYLVFVDEFTKFTWTVEGEFLSTPFTQFCLSKGILHHLSCPHTPQQNGAAERKHRHLVQCALALAFSIQIANVILVLCYLSTAAHLINKLPTPNLGNQSPWETLYHVSPDLNTLENIWLSMSKCLTAFVPVPIPDLAATYSSLLPTTPILDHTATYSSPLPTVPIPDHTAFLYQSHRTQCSSKTGTLGPLVPLPSSKNVVGCKWVYKLKTHSDVSLNWPLRQLDVKNAFLHGTLKEEVLHDFNHRGTLILFIHHYVCKLQKSIYGLKQAPKGLGSMVGALHYLTFTRPDISFAVHQVTQMLIGLGIQMINVPHLVFLSTWATMPLLGPPRNKLTVSRSSTESEYRALAIAFAELCWIRSLLKDLGIYLPDPPTLWCDNISALAIASNPVFHARTKHIEVDFHFVRERVLRKDLVVKFVSTVDQLADIFTKSLSTHRFLELRRNLTITVPKIEGG
uniref:Integrase catalytic domain-containing protein n=1 Tax=Fagus sylvatica TaxID=28930 RepID=A0A2N9G1Z1_FAGSY